MKRCARYVNVTLALGAAGLLLPKAALACERCFGAASNSTVVYGIGLSMLALLVLTVVVWGGFITFFNNMDKRAKMLASGELVVMDDGKVVTDTVAHASDRLAREVVDELLDKINRKGYGSLSVEEQLLLKKLAE